MIGIFILILSFLAFLIPFLLSRKNGTLLSRRGVTGYEIARYILDINGGEQVAIDVLNKSNVDPYPLNREIYLEKKIYEGKNFLAIGRAARQVILAANLQQTILPLDLKSRVWKPLKGMVFLSWALLFLSLSNESFGVLRNPAFVVLSFVFFMSLVNLPAEGAASQKAFSFLKQSHFFEFDELIRLKNILTQLRFEGLSQIYKIPWDVIKSLFRRRKKSVYGV